MTSCRTFVTIQCCNNKPQGSTTTSPSLLTRGVTASPQDDGSVELEDNAERLKKNKEEKSKWRISATPTPSHPTFHPVCCSFFLLLRGFSKFPACYCTNSAHRFALFIAFGAVSWTLSEEENLFPLFHISKGLWSVSSAFFSFLFFLSFFACFA